MTTTDKPSLGINDKYGQELFAGDSVQVVNGAQSGKVLYNIRAAAKAFTIEGDLSVDKKEPIQVSSKKVTRLKPDRTR